MRRESVKRSKKTWKTSCPSGQVTRDVQVSAVPVEADMYEKEFQAGAIALSAALFSGQSKLTAFDPGRQ
jgi:hypothetical protein